MSSRRLVIAFSITSLVALGIAGIEGLTPSARADDAQSAIDARRALMKEIGAQMKAMYAVVDAKSGDMADMEKRALVVQADAAKIPALFPAGTSIADMPDKTHALPAIWQNMDMFKKDAADLGTEAGKLAEAAKSGDMSAFAAQFEMTGKACGSCHTDFRAKLN
jgi:cytochrome c556